MGASLRHVSIVVAGDPPAIPADRISANYDWMLVWSVSAGRDLALQCKKLSPCILIAHQDLLTDGGLSNESIGPGLCLPTALLLVSDADQDALHQLFLRFPFAGFVRSHVSQARLTSVLQSIVSGELWLPRKMMTRLIGDYFSSQPGERRLTQREIEVLGLIDQGLNNQEIGELLGISRETVRWYIRSLNSKIRIPSRQRRPGQARSGLPPGGNTAER